MTAAQLFAMPLALGLLVLTAGCGGGSAKPAAVQGPPPTLAPVESTAVPATATAPASAPAVAASDPAGAELSRVDADMSSLDSLIAAVDQARTQSDG